MHENAEIVRRGYQAFNTAESYNRIWCLRD